MRFTKCLIEGAWTIDPAPHRDERGRFMRAWCRREFVDQGIDFEPVQANMSQSASAGTIRGLHFQVAPHAEAKLVRCTRGSVFDVLVDLRQGSPTVGRWFGLELSAENGRMLFVPPLCAHGYQTLVSDSETHYMTSAYFAPASARGLRFDDPELMIEWPKPVTAVSQQDRTWPVLRTILQGEQ